MSSPELGTDENEAKLATSRSAMSADSADPNDTPASDSESDTKPINTPKPDSTAEQTTTPGPTSPKPHRPHKKHKFICVLSLVITCLLLVGVSFMVGRFLSRPQDSSQDPSTTPDQPIVSGQPVPEEPGAPIRDTALIPEQDQLILAFLKLHNDQKNACYSPLSIRYALAMLREGANGESRAQIDHLLGGLTPKRYDNIADHLSTANSLWVKTGLENGVKPSFIDILQSQFGASFQVDDFSSAANINAWTEQNTLGLLKNALSDDEVIALKAALVNVLAIDMNWVTEFDKLATAGQDFYTSNGSMEATTMHYGQPSANLSYSFAEDAVVFASNLKEYNGTQLQFVAIMPEDLPAFISKASVADLNRLISDLRPAVRVNNSYTFYFSVNIPKFKIDGGLPDLIQDLKTLGVTDVFDSEKADFSNMTTGEGFFIDTATHKTNFEFTEEGIRAAALTLFGGKGAAGGPHNLISVAVVINKPFLYLVRDIDSGDIWFAGTVYQPDEWDESKKMYTDY